ncbi:MAG: hypothetical protein JW741_10665 [Sedimentisphaerales bacterium]|nr:hypothetical protein [Sedimentisphaerales bacterium]
MIRIETGARRGEESSRCSNHVGGIAILALLLCASVCRADIANPGFERARSKYSLPYDACYPYSWSRTATRPGFALGTTEDWNSEGLRSARIYGCYNQAVSAGDYMSFYQTVDLTGIRTLVFDAKLAAYPWGLFKNFEAVLLVEDRVVWSQTEDGYYKDVQVDVSRFSGWCRIELRCQALVSASRLDASYHALWDHLRAVEGPSFIDASIDLDPDTLNLASNGRYVTCYIELPLEYSVDDIDGWSVELVEGDVAIRACKIAQCNTTSEGTESNTSDRDGDGFCEYMVKFDRAAVQEALAGKDGSTTLTVTGNLKDGLAFKGTDTIVVVNKPGQKNKKGK